MKKRKPLYIYADESGNTGKNIFDPPPFYWQGAIFSFVDLEPILEPIVNKYCQTLEKERLHAKELNLEFLLAITNDILNSLDGIEWNFFVVKIEKSYIAVTKFVDLIFDPYENKAVPWIWYNHELFRHSVCCFFDDFLSLQEKQFFWINFLKNNYKNVSALIRKIINNIYPIPLDERLKEIIIDALSFFCEYSENFTFHARPSRSAYKEHSPNIVGFSVLINTINNYCKQHNAYPKLFCHDEQKEFKGSFEKLQEQFHKIRIPPVKNGIIAKIESIEYNWHKFFMASSKNHSVLQVVDLLLYIYQKKNVSEIEKIKEKIPIYNEYEISRTMSEHIIRTNYISINTKTDLRDEIVGKSLLSKLEKKRKKKLYKLLKK